MARTLVLVLTAAVLSIALAVPASAHIVSFNVGVTSIGYEQDQAFATGSINCTAGETYRISMRVRQKTGFKGVGVATGTCDGTAQNWEIQAQESGDALSTSSTGWFFVAKTFESGVLHDEERFRRVDPPLE